MVGACSEGRKVSVKEICDFGVGAFFIRLHMGDSEQARYFQDRTSL